MTDDGHGGGSQWGPALVLLAVIVLAVLGWLWFPRLSAYMHRQDCIASGHVNCEG